MDIEKQVKDFYEKNPYPLQKVKTKKDLFGKTQIKVMKNIFSACKMPHKNLKGKNVLDAGCGTGEKAIYCALLGANVDAIDISKTSIKIAKENAKKLNAKVNFMVDSFEKFQPEKKYDLILCIGSLHHSSNPKENFKKIASLLAKNGRITLGLYNLYGRLGIRIVRKLLWMNEKEWKKVIEKTNADKEKSKTWSSSIKDRFACPYESYHSLEEAICWFEENKLKPISTWPIVDISSKIDMKIKQLEWLVKGKGFFFIGGKDYSSYDQELNFEKMK